MIDGKRIGLVGYSCASGLGELNRQIARHLPVDRWLVKPHRAFGVGDHPDTMDVVICEHEGEVDQFVRSVDILLFCETPFYGTLVQSALQHRRRLVCVPMVEWSPRDWMEHLDLAICPTIQCFSQLSPLVPSQYLPWPVDCRRFEYQPRHTCESFLFLNGHGGHHGRKGGDLVKQLKQVCPAIPVYVRSQRGQQWPGCTVLPSDVDNSLIYDQGDVLLVPHSTDGIGLEQLEAMSCGMPVISTDGEPWNELPAIGKIKATRREPRKFADWYLPEIDSFVATCKQWLGKSIASESQESRRWVERRSWQVMTDQFCNLITGA